MRQRMRRYHVRSPKLWNLQPHMRDDHPRDYELHQQPMRDPVRCGLRIVQRTVRGHELEQDELRRVRDPLHRRADVRERPMQGELDGGRRALELRRAQSPVGERSPSELVRMYQFEPSLMRAATAYP
jgi:hypothetical protein